MVKVKRVLGIFIIMALLVSSATYFNITGTVLAEDGEYEKGTCGEITARQVEFVLESPVENSPGAPGREPVARQAGWQDIMTDGFEGSFPGSWIAFADSGPDAYWGKDGYRSRTGSYSAFCAKNGNDGVDPPAKYLDNMDAWMVYGPFSLADATDAELNFWLWLESESGYDGVACMASDDGINYSGTIWRGSSSGVFVQLSLDLSSLCGQSQVWIAFIFISNESNTYQGAFIDDVVLRKYTTGVEPTWTFMVYADGDNNLEQSELITFNLMETAADNPNVNVVVQIDRIPGYDSSNGDWTTTRRYKVKHDTDLVNFASYTQGVDYWDLGELNMADPTTLSDFVSWVKTNYPADNYCLVLANHGSGWQPRTAGEAMLMGAWEPVPRGIIWDDTSGDYMSTADMGSALNTATSGGTEKLDVLFLDACLMQMIEVGYEVKGYSQYLVTSEYVGWGPGPYQDYVAYFTSTTTAEELAKAIVNYYHNSLAGSVYAHTMSAVDLSQFGLASVVSDFAQVLTTGLSTYRTQIENSRSSCQKFYIDSYIDLYHFAFLVNQNIADTTIQNAAQAVMTAVNNAVIAEAHENGGGGEYYPLDNAYGISIYFPASEGDSAYTNYNASNLAFVADQGWDEFLAAFFGLENTPPEVTNVTASQSSPTVEITYDIADAEQSEVTISFEYWDGASWQPCNTTTGEGTQTLGTGKSGTWNAKTDFDEHYLTDCKIRVIADDGQAENSTGSGESSDFTLDTKDPTGYGGDTPADGTTDVPIDPNFTCLTASDDNPPISYYFQIAENDTFTLNPQGSGWQSGTTWSPATLSYSTQYFWRVKAKDSYDNETDYSATFDFTTEAVPNNPPDAPASPLCEGATNPTGVNDPTPEFGWTFSDPDGGDTQGAYQVLVASSSGNLTADNGDIWHSGKVLSSVSEVSYNGTALVDNQTYFWKVKTWDNHDAEGPYCGEQQFTMSAAPDEVWVDDDWTGLNPGDPADGHVFGFDAFAGIQDGIDAVAGSIVHVAAGTYNENITLKDGVEVLGAGADVTIIDGGGSGSVVIAIGAGSGTKLDGFTITNGSADSGGGIYNLNSSPTVTNCTFSGNSADYGGGMYNEDSSPTVTNCTFSDNSAEHGGGMFNSEASPTVTNCTFYSNSVTYEGGGIYNIYDCSPIVTNCIISNNTASQGGGIYSEESSPVIDYNNVWNNSPDDYSGCSVGPNDISQDPMFVNPSMDDYHLQLGSPCTDAGDNTAVPAWLTTDFEGDPRILDGDSDTVAVVDMGVDEYVPLPNTSPEVTNITASQGSGIVDISYDVSDAEQSDVTISFEYWDGASWQPCNTTTGEGTQTLGTGKSGTWNAKTDFDEHYLTDCKIRVTADDGQAENSTGSGESSDFTLDTKDPTGYGGDTPADGATDVPIDPNLTCLTASDNSPPISYYFQLAENDNFSQGLQESGWQSSTTWAPSTLSYSTQYFWRVKAKDIYDNESDYSATFAFTTEVPPNTPPTAPAVDVTPNVPVTGDDLLCTVTTVSTDPDGDTVTYTYQWYKDGVLQSGETTTTTDLTDTVSSDLTAAGETWKCVVTPNDGTADGPSAEDQVTIAVASKTETVNNGELDATAEADTEVEVDGSANITVAKYDNNPGTGFSNDIGKYVDVYIEDVTNVNEIQIRLYYTESEISGRVESTLKLYWWNGSDWEECLESGVYPDAINGYSGYIWANIRDDTTPSLDDLVGTPFSATAAQEQPSGGGGGGAAGGGGGGGGVVGEKRFTQLMSVTDQEFRLLEDVEALSVDIKFRLFIEKGTVVKNKFDSFLTSILVETLVTPPDESPYTEIIGSAYDAGPNGAKFEPPALLTLKYDEEWLPEGITEDNLYIAVWNEETQEWERIECTVYPDEDIITAYLSHISIYTIMTGTRPAELELSKLTINPVEVDAGEDVTVSVLVTNTGDLAGSFEVKFVIDNVVRHTQLVTLKGQESRTVSFNMNSGDAGEHKVNVNGLVRTFTVKALEALSPPAPVVEPAPASFTISDLSVTPVEPKPAEQVFISALVTNSGGREGNCNVALKINGTEEAKKEIILGAGKSEKVTFAIAKEILGSYTVDVNGSIAAFTITMPPQPPTPAPVEALPVETPTNWGLIGGIIAVCIVIIGLLVYFFVWRKRGVPRPS